MEIFQTIWNLLITENERLSNILISPFLFVEVCLYMLIFLSVLNISNTKKQKITFVVTYAILAIINILFIPMPYYTFINILLCPVLVFFVFKTTFLNALLSQVTMYIISLIIGTPMVLIFSLIFGTTPTNVSIIPIYRLVYSFFFYLALFAFYKWFPMHKITFKFLRKFKLTNNQLFIINFILGTLSIGIQFYIEFTFIEYIPIYLILMSISILLAYFVTSIYSLLRTNKLEITTQDLEAEKLYNHTLTLLYDEIRGFKHNFNNTVQGIGGYIATNNMEGLKEYYNEVLEECQIANNLSILSPEIINHPAVYSLLTSKYHEATGFGIKVTLEIFMDLTTINMKIYDFTKVLGILIDNAIEASKQCEEKEIIITFRNDNKRNKQLFIIENTYANKNVNIDEIFEKGKTSKTNEDAKNHGLGLWEVKQIVKKNKNLDLYTTKNNKYFKQQFEIYS